MLDEEMLAKEMCQPINNMKLHKPAKNSANSIYTIGTTLQFSCAEDSHSDTTHNLLL